MNRNSIKRKALLLAAVACGLLAARTAGDPLPGPGPRPDCSASVGGVVGPGGVEIQCDLPDCLQKKNIAAKGLGCCVFRSIDHASHWQNTPACYDMPEWMVQKGLAGGGYPEKAAKLIEQIAADRGMPAPTIVQVEGVKDMEFLKLAHRTGRMTCVTYSKSPTGRYSGQTIAHMVNLAHCDDRVIATLDNNYIGSDAYEWATHDEFLRVSNPKGYWALVLLTPPPPPAPRN